MSFRSSLDTRLHRFLRIPYSLNTVVFQNPKKPRATYVFIHGIGNTLHAWDEVVHKMPHDVRLIGVDLLGFGDSPKPTWAIYNAKTQARSVALTLLSMRMVQQPILVGHSLGALVAVEVAKRYPLLVKELVLCSPPFYRPQVEGKKGIRSTDDILRQVYRYAKNHSDRLQKFSTRIVKLGLANRALNITTDNVVSYMAALESSIINQTSLSDVAELKIPITILYGALDPVVIGKHIVKLAKEHENVTAKRLLVGHEVLGSYVTSLVKVLKAEGTQ